MNYKSIKTKRPWGRVLPVGHYKNFHTNAVNDPEERPAFGIVTQADFLREYYPSGHRIYDKNYYPDIYKYAMEDEYDEDGNPTGKQVKMYYCEELPRVAFAFQQIITTKQLVHLCGNDIQFDVNASKTTQSELDNINLFRQGWQGRDMETAFFKLAKSVKITGDGALAFYLKEGKVGWKELTFLNGDKLYPHYDETGKLTLFARSYMEYDDEGDAITEWLEVWDETTYTRYKRPTDSTKSIVDKIKGLFHIEGYQQVGSKATHGFHSVPVVYHRNEEGACWSASQDTIDQYELAYSQMSHNNKAYGEPILVCQGDGISAMHDEMGTVKSIEIQDTEGKVDYLQAQSASESFMKELEEDFKMIYKQSFVVDPPELKAGDTPAAAIKILYSPAVEKAMGDVNEYQKPLNDMVDLFTWGYGIECEKTLDFANLPMNWWIKPYVHVNEDAIITDLVQGVQAGFISKRTASEKASFLTTADEYSRITAEQKEEQEADLLYNVNLLKSKQGESKNENNTNKE